VVSRDAVGVDVADGVRAVSVGPVGLKDDLVHRGADVDVVHVGGSEVGLERFVDVLHRNPEHFRLLPVEIDPDVRRVRRVGAEGVEKLRRLGDLSEKLVQNLSEPLRIVVDPGLEPHVQSAGDAESLDGGRSEHVDFGLRDGGGDAPDLADDALEARVGGVSIGPGVEGGDDGPHVLSRVAHETESDDVHDVFDPRNKPELR